MRNVTDTVDADFAAAFPLPPSQTQNTPNNRENGEGGVVVATAAAAPAALEARAAPVLVDEITRNNVGAALTTATPTPPSQTANTRNNHENGEGEVVVATVAAATAAVAAALEAPAAPAQAAARAAPVEQIHDFTGTTQSIEDSHIITNTRNTYNRSLTDFMIWLFSFSRDKLVRQVALIAAKEQDDQRPTVKQRNAKKWF